MRRGGWGIGRLRLRFGWGRRVSQEGRGKDVRGKGDVRFFTDVKVLLEELDQTQLDNDMRPCSFLQPNIS